MKPTPLYWMSSAAFAPDPTLLAVSPASAPAPRPQDPGLLPMQAAQSLPRSTGSGWLPPSFPTVAPTARSRTYQFTIPGQPRDVGEVRVTLEPASILIHDLKVTPTKRGDGLGAQLLETALRFGARAGRRIARLDADDDGSGKLLRWYQKAGFRFAGVGRAGRPAMRADIGKALEAIRHVQR